MEGKHFQREEDLLKIMTSDNQIPDLSNLSISEDKKDDFYHGPLLECFYFVQCPFTWIEDISHDGLEGFVSDSQNFVAGDPQKWQTFCAYIFFAYCLAKLGKFNDALKHIKVCRELLTDNAEDKFFKDIFEGMTHALDSSAAHIHFIKGDADKADEIMAEVTEVQDLSRPCQAALTAMHATVSHNFGLKPKEKTIAMYKEAAELDPDEEGSRRGAWYFFVGKRTGQLRRMNHRTQMPSEEELKYLERAIKYNPLPDSLATLAEAKGQAARFAGSNSQSYDVTRKIHSLNLEAKSLLVQAYQLDEINASTLRRCGNGLMYLHARYRDIPLATECLVKCISLNPKNAPAYHSLGTLEERHNNNTDKALKYYQLSIENGNLISALSEIRLRFKMDNSYNPLQYCDTCIEKTQTHEVKAAFMVTKGEYYLYVKKDLINAAKEWEKVIELDPDSDNLKKHWRVFPERGGKPSGHSMNVYLCLKNAIEAEQQYGVSGSDELYLDHILKICESHT